MSDRQTSSGTKPTSSPDRRGQRHQAKRALIVANAWTLARRDGLAAISLRDLADSVDLRQPSLYAYFESKLDLYDAMFEDGQRHLLERSLARSPLDDPREEVVAIVEDLVRFSSEDTVRHQLLFQRTIPGFEPSESAMEPAQRFFELMVARLGAAGLDEPTDVDVFSAIAGSCSPAAWSKRSSPASTNARHLDPTPRRPAPGGNHDESDPNRNDPGELDHPDRP